MDKKDESGIGTIKMACDIGKKGKRYWVKAVCTDCGKERWLKYNGKKTKIDGKCVSCSRYFKEKDYVLNPCPNPKLGDMRYGRDINKCNDLMYTWSACIICGKERWVEMENKSIRNDKCLQCACIEHIKPINPCPNPKEGDIRFGRDIGRVNDLKCKYVYKKCLDCNNYRWVAIKHGKPVSQRCRICGVKSNVTKHIFAEGSSKGRHRSKEGYIYIRVEKDNFFYSMATGGYIVEHRLVMAKHLGRCLQKWEVVHHKNGIRDDNVLSNLTLADSVSTHIREHSRGYRDGYDKGLIDGKDKQIHELKELIENQNKWIRLLVWKDTNITSINS